MLRFDILRILRSDLSKKGFPWKGAHCCVIVRFTWLHGFALKRVCPPSCFNPRGSYFNLVHIWGMLRTMK